MFSNAALSNRCARRTPGCTKTCVGCTKICVGYTTTKETPYIDFWVHLLNVPEYRSIAEKAISMLIQMPATYLCKSVFSYLCEIKSRKRSSITHIDPLMRGTIEKEIIPRFELMANNMQQQKNIKYYFLHFLACFM